MKDLGKSSFELKIQRILPASRQNPAQAWVEKGGEVGVLGRQRRFERVCAHDLEQIDKALELVQGSFLAAAKLLDMDPQRFRNLVNYHPQLKEKWGRRRGRQPRLNFRLRFP